ncbi:MAG: M24 family metallopeptidase [Gemmatimonadota bacterium]
MSGYTALDPVELRAALTRAGADGWLLFDFHGLNPVATRVLGIEGLATRRLFVWIPAEGEPIAVAHRIELAHVKSFPGRVLPYARWGELHEALRSVVHGKRCAMEISPLDAVPYLDRVPSGVVQLVERLGGQVVSSAPLVNRFAATWTAAELADHRWAAEALAEIAQAALRRAVASAGTGLTECQLQAQVIDAMKARGLVLSTPPIVAFGPNAANPHYEPVPGEDATLDPDQVVLLDLWAARGPHAVFADQTWMGFAGTAVPDKVRRVWAVVRDARDAAIAAVRRAAEAGKRVPAFTIDRAARGVIDAAGYGEYFVHRTGHSIDRDLHGSGPHLDDYETHDDRELGPGLGFSVEPGVYLPGEFGVRSEVNVYWDTGSALVTPARPQEGLIGP